MNADGKRLIDGADVVIGIVRNLIEQVCIDGIKIRAGARTLASENLKALTDVVAAGFAQRAGFADFLRTHDHTVADLDVFNVCADFHNIAAGLVAERDGAAHEGMFSIICVNVGAANSNGTNLNQGLIRGNLRNRNFADFKCFGCNKCCLLHK